MRLDARQLHLCTSWIGSTIFRRFDTSAACRIAERAAEPLRFQSLLIDEISSVFFHKERNSMDRRTFLGSATAAAIATGLHPDSFLLLNPAAPKLKPMALGLLISPYQRARGDDQARSRHGIYQLLSFAGRIYRQVHAGCCEADWRSCWRSTRWLRQPWRLWDRSRWCGISRRGRRRSGWFLPRPCGADRCAETGLGFCEAARHRAGADALRIHPGRPCRCFVSGNGGGDPDGRTALPWQRQHF